MVFDRRVAILHFVVSTYSKPAMVLQHKFFKEFILVADHHILTINHHM